MKLKDFFYLLIGVCFLCQSCGEKDGPGTNFKDVTLNCEQTYTITGGEDIEWKSDNPLIASVSGNIVTANVIGETSIRSSKGSFKVTVKGIMSKVYDIPCLEWGASKSRVKSFMSGRTLSKETTTDLVYYGSGAEIMTMYTFQSDKLKNSGVALSGSYISSSKLADYMLERYIPVSYDEDSYYFYFVTPDKKTGLALTLSVSGGNVIYMIAYVPYSSTYSQVELKSYSAFDWQQYIDIENNEDLALSYFEEIKNALNM
ncbi:MAG: hypothetical protein IKW05_02220 [Muribaculaceae bacterium]|nr:hypothetical protein [Muribaculaceae bacterium]